ncbi:MAG TPA: hypothetical protein PKH89_11730 [Anaerolineae bacterium]|nr:hypothetical protein [Anaerolineae bacterium]
MAIGVVRAEGNREMVVEQAYNDEGELQELLEQNPYLLKDDSEPEVVTVSREVGLPVAGSLDLLLLDKTGLPVAVEVKLERNPQSRREVVAQAIDYITDLSSRTFEELDDLVEGKLSEAVYGVVGEQDPLPCRRRCAENLRAGRFRLVIAVDSAPDPLVRNVQYLADHADIDIRLIAITKYDHGRILVPRVMARRLRLPPVVRKVSPELDAAASAYNRLVKDEDWLSRGKGVVSRQICPPSWPRNALHYEFLLRKDGSDRVGAELHLEEESVRELGERLRPLAARRLDDSRLELQWDSSFYKGRGRLVYLVPANDPELAASAMLDLIQISRPVVEEWLRDHPSVVPSEAQSADAEVDEPSQQM